MTEGGPGRVRGGEHAHEIGRCRPVDRTGIGTGVAELFAYINRFLQPAELRLSVGFGP